MDDNGGQCCVEKHMPGTPNDGFEHSTLREVNTLALIAQFRQHPHVLLVQSTDVVVRTDEAKHANVPSRFVLCVRMPRFACDAYQWALSSRTTGKAHIVGAERFLRHVVAALEFLHSNGVLHRDVKPSNVLVDGVCHKTGHGGRFLLADFGSSREMAVSMRATRQPRDAPMRPAAYVHADETYTPHVTTAPYRAPETVDETAPNGVATYGPGADVFSAVVSSLNVATGRALPDRPLALTPALNLLWRQATGAGLFAETDAVLRDVRAALSTDPTARPSASVLRAALWLGPSRDTLRAQEPEAVVDALRTKRVPQWDPDVSNSSRFPSQVRLSVTPGPFEDPAFRRDHVRWLCCRSTQANLGDIVLLHTVTLMDRLFAALWHNADPKDNVPADALTLRDTESAVAACLLIVTKLVMSLVLDDVLHEHGNPAQVCAWERSIVERLQGNLTLQFRIPEHLCALSQRALHRRLEKTVYPYA